MKRLYNVHYTIHINNHELYFKHKIKAFCALHAKMIFNKTVKHSAYFDRKILSIERIKK